MSSFGVLSTPIYDDNNRRILLPRVKLPALAQEYLLHRSPHERSFKSGKLYPRQPTESNNLWATSGLTSNGFLGYSFSFAGIEAGSEMPASRPSTTSIDL